MKAAAKAITVVALVFIVGFLSGIGAIACFQAIRLRQAVARRALFATTVYPVYAGAR